MKICKYCQIICPNLPLLLIFAIVIGSYYAYVLVFCLHYLQSSVVRAILMVPYHILLLMFMWCLLMTTFVTSYPISSRFIFSHREQEAMLGVMETQRNLYLEDVIRRKGLRVYTRSDKGFVRYCQACACLKPDRAHHCSSCGVCVPRMDHHCPWINNCVSASNNKQFILMLLYGTLYCVYYCASAIPSLIMQWKLVDEQNVPQIILCCWCVVAGIFAVLLGCFTCFHIGLVLENKTTLENIRSPVFVDFDMTWNLGKKRNVEEVMGEPGCLWAIPVTPSIGGDACEFPVGSRVGYHLVVGYYS